MSKIDAKQADEMIEYLQAKHMPDTAAFKAYANARGVIDTLQQISQADEVKAQFMDDTSARKDRENFVRSIGDLLAQTREKVVSTELIGGGDEESVKITFKGGSTKKVNVTACSYMAIVKSVVEVL